jgi:hypothetical protein
MNRLEMSVLLLAVACSLSLGAAIAFVPLGEVADLAERYRVVFDPTCGPSSSHAAPAR